MFCPNCGIEIKNPEAFCPNCGTRLPQDISVTNDVQEKQEKSATRKMPQEKVQLKAHREQCTEEVNEKYYTFDTTDLKYKTKIIEEIEVK